MHMPPHTHTHAHTHTHTNKHTHSHTTTTNNNTITNTNAHTGEGPAKTRLVFPQSLTKVLGPGSYTYGPAFLQFNGASWTNANTLLSTVTAVRGARWPAARPRACGGCAAFLMG
jgi:hypothetical protein